VWFVGVTPRRNPELVVAVLWQNGEFSYYSARIAAQIVSAYVEKQRRLQHNLPPLKAQLPAPAEVGAVWSTPGSDGKHSARKGETASLHAGHFFVSQGQIVPASQAPVRLAPALRSFSGASAGEREPRFPSIPTPANLSKMGAALPVRPGRGQ
jgi:hypothetical protein